jgi:protein subunit release factor A
MMSEDIHKWTDGRYTLMFDEHTFFVWDNENDERMTALNVTKKLNEQQDKITELEKNFEDLVNWSTEISKRNVLLDEKIGRLQQEEKLYAQEILRLNELLKQYQSFKDLGGDY